MGYLNPRPDEASIGRFYPENYEPYQPPKTARNSPWSRLRERLLGPDRDSMTALPLHGKRRLLDYGCGSGWFGHRMRERGWQVTGMDMSAYAVESARNHFKLTVIHGTLPHADIGPESFDVVTLGAVLEHLHWPHRVIGAAVRALTPGGYLVLSVPNVASWGFRFFGSDWFPLELPRHLLHFTPQTLQRLVQMHGLEVTDLRMLGRTNWMRRSLANRHERRCREKNKPNQPARRNYLAAIGRVRMMQSWLTRWTVWTGQADCLLLVARRPAASTTHIGQAA